MQNTKLGISSGLMGAILFMAAMGGTSIALIVLAGYILLAEENVWLKRTAVKAVVIAVMFTVLSYLIALIPSFIDIIEELMAMFDSSISNGFFDFIDDFLSFVDSIVYFVKIALLLLLVFKSLKNATVIIAPIDNFINKHIN